MKDPAVREVLQYLYDLVHVYGYAPVREENTDDSALFCSGRVASIFTGTYILSSFEANNFDTWNVASARVDPKRAVLPTASAVWA